MLKTARLITLVCFVGCAATAWPLIAQIPQDATDAVQDIKIATLERTLVEHSITIAAINDKMNYTLGGVAGMYALLGIIGIFNSRMISNKK